MSRSTDPGAGRKHVLIVDDDIAVGKVLAGILGQAGFEARHLTSAKAALEHVERQDVDVVITDLRMPDMDGMALLAELGRTAPHLPTIMLTAHGTVARAVEAMRAGATDFLTKPFDRDEVIYTVEKAARTGRDLIESPPQSDRSPPLLGGSSEMREALALVERAAKTSSTVLIRGESGTGKELAARSIHLSSPRRSGPFVAVNCAALPDQLLESELFGYEKGAFTGAANKKPGRVDLAAGGTLFLDEIGDVPLTTQVKLLRLLQEKEFERLGGTRTEKADVRFVAATHRDLEDMTKKGTFREDLYYRLGVIPIWMPPLRARRSDIGELAARFTAGLAKQNQRDGLSLSQSAVRALERHDWPGNVRELLAVVERLVVFTDEATIQEEDVLREIHRMRGGPWGARSEPTRAQEEPEPEEAVAPSSGADGLLARRAEAERAAISDALQRAADNRSQAARLLGISRRTLYKRLTALGMS